MHSGNGRRNLKNSKSVLVLGSSALKIGEAGEFDYSGSQTLKALSEEGIRTILVNPNIATVQTSKDMADRIYFLPVTPFFVKKVIEKERPDAIVLASGGQTALNCGVSLYEDGVFEEYGIQVLGTPVEAIILSEDRQKFADHLKKEKLPIPVSRAVNSISEVAAAGEEVGYPCMVRVAFALGGLGSGVCRNPGELKALAEKAFVHADQLLIGEYLEGWKEIEYEIVRDSAGTCLAICNMENLDPMGIHTGESIVVAPSQTLNNTEYHQLRTAAMKVASSLNIVGECNVQFALSPHGKDYRIIEANARLSRSSALASKATGYPLAYVAAKLALGQKLHEITNTVTGCTTAAFEPAMDYIVVKIPRWDFEKFKRVSSRIGSSMKSVGEVMAISRSFEESLQKALRMLQTGKQGLVFNDERTEPLIISSELKNPSHNRLFAVAESLAEGTTTNELNKITGIDLWFLEGISKIVKLAKTLEKTTFQELDRDFLLTLKKSGFSDKQIANAMSIEEKAVRTLRYSKGIRPCVKQIDTVAGEYPASTNYLYLTYNGTEDDVEKCSDNSVIVLGSGTYCVGSSVEFDWCCVSAVKALSAHKVSSIVINNNPETVSTDFDQSDRLYFEELSLETLLEIYSREDPAGVILYSGGQVANNLAIPCMKEGIHILGTSAENIDRAESRHIFSSLLEELEIPQPPWQEASSKTEIHRFARETGYPVLVRPSYVLSGAAMGVATNPDQLDMLLKNASSISRDHPVVLSKYIEGAREIDLDGVAQNGIIVLSAISEHVENAGVHSGDATLVFPPQRIYLETMRQSRDIATKIAKALNINGPFNIQLLAKDNKVMVIECNLRASRSFPFVSKIMGRNLISAATDVVMGKIVEKEPWGFMDLGYVGVKAPQFSFTRLDGADPVTGVEMASTGEVAALGKTFNEAYLKALMCVGYDLPPRKIVVSLDGVSAKAGMLEGLKTLGGLGVEIWAPPGTSSFLTAMNIPVLTMPSLESTSTEQINKIFSSNQFSFLLSISDMNCEKKFLQGYTLRRCAADRNIPVMTSLQAAKRLCEALGEIKYDSLEIKGLDEYLITTGK
ncbi:MAG: carbamoyl-phosphate synthase (glutamine-hydrolyzing) large subunit [Candidatus Sabulitectum sp.]|nr:carbamoyl-phosphate synthase (glutamine-hydrolyzing) large subunit [Candidatus Sabulitectum sp.]